MFNLIFKRSISPIKKLDKQFQTNTATFDCVLKEGSSLFKPTFIISTGDDLGNYNYIDGTDFSGRLYTITEIKSIGNALYEVSAKTDVRSTWKSEIRSNDAVIKRQENQYNLYLDDPEFMTYNTEQISTYKFSGTQFDKTLSYVLVVNGS